jgi:Tol biopolymer transport system component
VAAGVEHGLLVPRDQRLLLRDMTKGTEALIAKAPADAYYAWPRWAPDGKSIAYALTTIYNGTPNQEWGSDIAVSAPDGSNQRIVFKRPHTGVTIEGLAWTPDGSGFYAGILDTQIKDGRFLGQTLTLERIDIATGARQVLVPDAANPSVTPDGSRLAYITYGTADQPGGLWTARSDGSERKLIVPATGKFITVVGPRFSPDGKNIAFAAVTTASGSDYAPPPKQARRWPWEPRSASAHGLPMDIWQVAADGGEPRRLTSVLEDEPSVAWSPSGDALAMIATGGLYDVPLASGDPKKLGVGATQAQIDWR